MLKIVKIEENNAKISEDMSSQIKIYSSNSRPRYFIVEECGGSLTLDEVVDLLQKTNDYEDYMLEEDIFYNNNIFHYYGATTIVNNLVSVPAYKKDEYNLNDLDDPCEHLPDNNLIEKTLDLDSYYTDQPGYEDGDKLKMKPNFFIMPIVLKRLLEL